MMIYQLRLIPQNEKRESVLQLLKSCISVTLAKPGCMDCSIFQEYDSADSILYTEQWSSEVDLFRHIQSPQFLRILAAMDMAEMPPKVDFHQVSSTSHLELVEAVRAKTHSN